eukprot:CAMPEP_0172459542 /NCGR_PEP_ID=MMETSP1065-20121228/33114_1 /TAXON_ID=265537 /ORGANISM="Amphiprora paludosa, Strain CCMP125" /LENGTH=67 /DNA_ID=CAMNT_0013214261 /DNA_START=26 /DNA_END=226 /DNA_ORIENTATION=+
MTKKPAGPVLDEATRKKATAWAQKKYEKMFHSSTIQDRAAQYPQFDYDEVEVGKVLGKGGFGTVYEV